MTTMMTIYSDIYQEQLWVTFRVKIALYNICHMWFDIWLLLAELNTNGKYQLAMGHTCIAFPYKGDPRSRQHTRWCNDICGCRCEKGWDIISICIGYVRFHKSTLGDMARTITAQCLDLAIDIRVFLMTVCGKKMEDYLIWQAISYSSNGGAILIIYNHPLLSVCSWIEKSDRWYTFYPFWLSYSLVQYKCQTFP